MQVKKAVFPVAGLGSRFLPATKANPKEMLPIVDKPLIQYAVEEAMRAGINHMIFITNSGKRAIEDHFDFNYELEKRLQEQDKTHLLNIVRDVSASGVNFTYIRQNQPLGLGHAILCAKEVVGESPFAVLLADDLIDDSSSPCLSEMTRYFDQKGHSIVAVQPVPWQDIHQYGVAKVTSFIDHFSSILDIIEKPTQQLAPSNLAAVGRYIFTPTIFSCIEQTVADHRGEIQLTDAIKRLISQQRVDSFQFSGKRYDCGSKAGYVKATIEMGLRHPEVKKELRAYLSALNLNSVNVS